MSKLSEPYKFDKEGLSAAAKMDKIINHARTQLDYLCSTAEKFETIYNAMISPPKNKKNNINNYIPVLIVILEAIQIVLLLSMSKNQQ